MKKRRRAYKGYDWQSHSLWLIEKKIVSIVNKYSFEALELVMLFGEGAIDFRVEDLSVKAGLWKITIPVYKPYLINPEREKERLKLSK